MSEKFIRIYQKKDIKEVQKHLMIHGALSASCANCNNLGLKIDIEKCPECETEFTYISFQNVRDHLPKLQKLAQERPDVSFVDYDDFKKLTGEIKAKEFLN